MNFVFLSRLVMAVVAAAFVLIGVVGCARNIGDATAQNAQPKKPILKTITPDDVSKLRWIEGSWRGNGDIDKPFYERYKLENPTTLVVESFDDDKFGTPSDVSRFELKDGEFGSNSANGARSAASAIDANSVTFEPVAKSRNSFRFERVSDNAWKAILNWPATDTTPAGQRTYNMERWPPAAK